MVIKAVCDKITSFYIDVQHIAIFCEFFAYLIYGVLKFGNTFLDTAVPLLLTKYSFSLKRYKIKKSYLKMSS